MWKLLLLGPGGWWLLARAQYSILKAAVVVRYRPRGELIRELAAANPPAGATGRGDPNRVEATSVAIDRVARMGLGRPLCLVRSIALRDLLVREGVSGSRIRVGVRHNSRGGFEAHAWVEWNGSVVGEDPSYVGLFRPFSDLQPRSEPVDWTPTVPAP